MMSHRRELTRRSLLRQAPALFAVGPGLIASAEMSSAQAGVSFEAYHGVSSATHQANVKRLSQRNFRPISLSVYGNPPNEQYAAVWVERSGPRFAAVHNLNGRDYQTAFDRWRDKGYAPTIVAATDSGNDEIFAAVFEEGVQGPWRARHNMTEREFSAEIQSAAEAQLKLASASTYGARGDARYIAVWHANPGFAKWHAFPRMSPDEFQRQFRAQIELPHFRLAGISVASDQSLCPLFTDQSIGTWASRHGMTSAEYQAEYRRQSAAGRMPVSVQGSGSGNSTRYEAIFAAQDQPLARRWTAAGPQVSELTVFDDMVREFMMKHAVRGAQLTIAQGGSIKLQRAYTWAGLGYRTIETTDRFLLASVSKMFVAAAVQRLYDQGRVQADAPAYPLLGFSRPKDPRSDTITVQQLLDHKAGYTHDPTYNMRRIAIARGLNGPAGKRDIAAWMYARDLDYPPGAAPDPQGTYNNYGFLLASLVVEHVAKQDYFQFLRSQVLQPDGISEVAVYPTAAASLAAGLVPIDDDRLGLSALAIKSDAQVPAVFGGDGMVKETAVGSAGLAASATALTQFIRRHAVWGIGARRVAARAGSTPGASTWAQSRAKGTDWALVMNTRIWTPGSGNAFNGLVKAINTELDRRSL